MDYMIYRNDSIAEENIDPTGRPAENKFEEWSGRWGRCCLRQGNSLCK